MSTPDRAAPAVRIVATQPDGSVAEIPADSGDPAAARAAADPVVSLLQQILATQ